MPSTGFFRMIRRHSSCSNTGSSEVQCQPQDADEDDISGDNAEPVDVGAPRPAADDTPEEENPEWEMGIWRSASSRSNRIEDLTLSDIILDPDGSITYYWLSLVTLVVIYNLAVIILRLAFEDMRDPVIEKSVFCVLDYLGDVIYVLDVIVHMRVSFFEEGCLVLDPQKIMDRYMHSRKFIFDVISVLPLGTVLGAVNVVCGFLYADVSSVIPYIVQILLVRLPRLLKYSTMSRYFDLTDSRTRNPNLLRAFKLSLNLWVVIHWVGCAYYLVSEHEGLGVNSWVYPSGPEYASFTRKYIRAMYWSLMTLTTIGERPHPETDLEFVFTGLTFLIGVFVFAAVVGNVGDVISNMNATRTEFQSR